MLDEYASEQKVVCQILKNAVNYNKIGHAYIFETNGYNKKEEIALAFAKMLLCPNHYSNCQKCNNCVQCENISKNIFSELKIIKPDGLWIKKEQLDELQKEFNNKGIESSRRVYIIEQADRLNNQSANSILKFLEEPEDNITAILITDNIYQMLSTIISRCQVITFARKNRYHQLDMEDKIKNNILVSVSEEKLVDIIDKVIQYVKYYESNGLDCILKNKKLWHNNFSEKEEILLALNLMILIYKDAMNLKTKNNLEIFDKYEIELKKIESNNSLDLLNQKIKTIINTKEKMNYNVNNGLLIDKLLLDLERCENND